MSKKKVKIILIGSTVVLVLLISILILNNLLSPKNKIRKDLENTLNCIIDNNFSNEFYYMNINGYLQQSIDMTEFDNMIATNVKFNILEIETESDEAIAKVEMEYPNLAKQLDGLKSTTLTEKSFDVNSAEKVKKNFEIYLIKRDEHWVLLQNKELMDVFSGGLSSVYSNKEKEIYEKLLEGIK